MPEMISTRVSHDPIFMQNGNMANLTNLSRKRYLQKKRILFHLYYKGQLSNPEICKLTNMSSPSIQKLLSELIGENLVREEGIGQSIGGRRPLMFGINAPARFVVGVNIGHSTTEIGVFDLTNKLVGTIQFFRRQLENSQAFVDALHREVLQVLAKAKVTDDQLLGIGIAITGLTDPRSGSSYSHLNFSEKSVKALFEEKFGKPVFTDNDARLMALGEYVFGSAVGHENVLCVNIGSGIGMGMILNGKLYQGHSGFAGEFGHIKIQEEGQLCRCGKNGCLETVASGDALTRMALAAVAAGKPTMLSNHTTDLGCNTIIDAAHQGDQVAIDLIAQIGAFLGQGLSTLIHLFNPETIILGGHMARAQQFLLDPVHQTLNKYTIGQIKNATRLVTSTLGDKAAVMGALALVMEHVFEDLSLN
ncbi:MAG: ROK family transcriptional regulator [Clostridia bacterium]|nr:ROK family transcriptional regulator [Clostridia bacterium]